MRPVTIFDLDGVLADCALGVLKLSRRLHGDHVPIHSGGAHRIWNFHEDPDFGLTAEQDEVTWAKIGELGTFWRRLDVLTSPGDLFEMRQLAQESDIVYLTNRFGYLAKEQTEEWLLANAFPEGELVVTSKKVEYASPYSPVAIIEDSPQNLIDYSLAGLPVVRMDRPYNRNVAGVPHDLPFVSAVSEFCRNALDEVRKR